MDAIKVKAARPYEVLIGRGLLDEAGALTARVHATCRLLLASDSNVFPLYLSLIHI